MPDEQPRPVAKSDEHNYTLTVEETADRYERAGISRTHRAIQKYCAVGKLDCRKTETEFGEKYLVAPYSIDRHIAYINSILPANADANVRDQPRPDAAVPSSENKSEEPRTQAPNSDERTRTDASVREGDNRYLGALERENEFLRGQIVVKDTQIKDLTDRARETNILMQGLQKILSPLLGTGDRRDEGGDMSTTGIHTNQ